MRNHVGSGNRSRVLSFAPLAHAYMILSEIIHSGPTRWDPWYPTA